MSRLLALLCMVIPLAAGAAAEAPELLKPVATVPLQGVEGRIDHMAVGASGRLYVAALGNNTVEVVDTSAGKQAGRITGLKKPQGVAWLPDSGKIAVTSGGDGKLRIYSSDQKLIGTVEGLDDADNVRYDPRSRLLYVGYGDGALAIIDPEKPQRVAEIKLEGHPESFQLETEDTRARAFVNVPSAKGVAVVDLERRSVVAVWKLKMAAANFPMALDEANHRLFVVCREPARLLIIDTQSGRDIATLNCVGDADDVFYDASDRRIYISGGEGAVDIVEQSDPDHYQSLGRVTTAPGARTSLLDTRQRRFYLAVPHRGGQQAEVRAFQTSGAGSF